MNKTTRELLGLVVLIVLLFIGLALNYRLEQQPGVISKPVTALANLVQEHFK